MTSYILKGKIPIICDNIYEWAEWFGTADRVVVQSTVHGIEISTVFLGINHRFGGNGDPLLFETMVFGGDLDETTLRYSTWEEAEKGHRDILDKVKRTEKVLLRKMDIGG